MQDSNQQSLEESPTLPLPQGNQSQQTMVSVDQMEQRETEAARSNFTWARTQVRCCPTAKNHSEKKSDRFISSPGPDVNRSRGTLTLGSVSKASHHTNFQPCMLSTKLKSQWVLVHDMTFSHLWSHKATAYTSLSFSQLSVKDKNLTSQ